jgi:hypothetical protein
VDRRGRRRMTLESIEKKGARVALKYNQAEKKKWKR